MKSEAFDRDGASARQPRILHLVPADGIGGVEVAAKSMVDRSDLPCIFRLAFIEPALSKKRNLGNILRLLAANRRTFHAAQTFDPDIIICSLWRAIPLALMLRATNRRARLVCFLHSGTTVHRADALLSAAAIRYADEVWADSASTLEMRGIRPGRGRVISFVTSHPTPRNKQFAGATFVSWGRLHHQKGFDRAVRLIGELIDHGIDAHYAIYGPNDGERDALEALIGQLDLANRVHLHPPLARRDLPVIAGRHSFFIQLSRVEGMCMAAVEAMQLGLVPVVTAVGEMRRYVRPGETGVVVDPVRLDEAAVRIASLLDNPVRWRHQSEAAMRYWRETPVYAEDVCATATSLFRRFRQAGETTT